MKKVTGKVPARTGLLLYAENGGNANIPTCIYTEPFDENLLVATPNAKEITSSDEYNYVLASQDGVVGFFHVGENVNSGAGKAYLHTSSALNSDINDARVSWSFDDDATAISAVQNAIIEKGIFDLQGRRVAQPAKGLYIVNGKKVIMD